MKRSFVLISALGALSLLAPTRADASDWTRKPRVVEDPYLAVEIRLGPYRPNVDDGVGKVACGKDEPTCVPSGPFQKVFGDDRRFMVGGEVTWQFLHVPHFASLGVGGSLHYSSFNGPAVFRDGGGESAETASLTVWMFGSVAALRIDVLARDFGIPFIPYLKFGPGVGFWSSSNGRGTSRAADGTLGRGHTFGLTYAAGLQLMLDFLDPQAAKTFSIERGVRHTYLFAEYDVLDYHGIGQTKPLYLGDKTWRIGFMFEL